MSALSFHGSSWWWIALLGVCILWPLASIAWRNRSIAISYYALFFRIIGIAVLLFCLLDPHWTSERPSKGANILAIVADNSEGLELIDPGEPSSRGELMRQRLEGPDVAWIDKLREDFDVRPYRFDRTLRRIVNFQQLDFSGEQSTLLKSLAQIKERFDRLPLHGIVLLTDGNATDFEEGLPDLSGLPPIYPVVVGQSNALADISLDRVEIRQSAFDDAPITLRATVSSTNMETPKATVSVKRLIQSDSSLESSLNEETPESKTLSLVADSTARNVSFGWKSIRSGIQFYEVAATQQLDISDDSPQVETTERNNRRTVMVDQGRQAFRILYVTGRPNWEYKFLNRALSEDPRLQMVGLIRVARREPVFEFKGRAGESSNPLFRGFGEQSAEEVERYDQAVMVRVNTKNKEELRTGFPKTAEELFAYDAVIIDDLEADFFSYNQQSLLRRFASERGGGLLMLGGADALDRGNYARTPLAKALPVYLDRPKPQSPSNEFSWKLTRDGWVEPWVRVRSNESDERTRLNSMPPFKVLNPLTSLKPGARVLAAVEDSRGNTYPGLVSQNYGLGRVACVAVGDLWRWGMTGENEYADLARFWRQLGRWLVSDTPSKISLQIVNNGTDEIQFITHARDSEYRPLESGQARITIKRQNQLVSDNEESSFSEVTLYAEPVTDRLGQFAASVTLPEAGSYRATVEITEPDGSVIGTAETGWVSDPSAKEFQSLSPNTKLLEDIAEQTGGKVLDWAELEQLGKELKNSPAPISEPHTYPIWNNPWVFFTILACFLSEWAIRRKRGLA